MTKNKEADPLGALNPFGELSDAFSDMVDKSLEAKEKGLPVPEILFKYQINGRTCMIPIEFPESSELNLLDIKMLEGAVFDGFDAFLAHAGDNPLVIKIASELGSVILKLMLQERILKEKEKRGDSSVH